MVEIKINNKFRVHLELEINYLIKIKFKINKQQEAYLEMFNSNLKYYKIINMELTTSNKALELDFLEIIWVWELINKIKVFLFNNQNLLLINIL